MPNRIIRESALTSATLYRLSDSAERFFWRMTLVADDFGRFEADPQVMKARCFPLWPDKKMSGVKVAGLYGELERAELVRSYAVAGKQYGFFATWARHQQIRAKHSKYPEPNESNLLASICAHLPADSFGIEKREANTRSENAGPIGAVNGSSPPVIDFQIPGSISTAQSKCPTLGSAAGLDARFWQAQLRSKPGVNFAAGLLAAEAWCVANPARAPKKNVPAFLNRWYGRAYEDLKP